MKFDAIIFDFDGVLLESEFEGNRHARRAADRPRPSAQRRRSAQPLCRAQRARLHRARSSERIGAPASARIPRAHARRRASRALREGIDAVAGAVDFVRSLPPDLPKAVASSSSTRWIRGHLDHLGLADAFGDHVYSGREHVERGKPAPDLYLHAAEQLGVDIARCVIIEDSRVGATGALASARR